MKESLACVRTANTAVEELLRNELLLHPAQVRQQLSAVRVELSVAAGHLARALDEMPAHGPAEGRS